MFVTTICGLVFVFLEFITLGLGWSVMYPEINLIQILLHTIGVTWLCLIILIGLSYTRLRPVLVLFTVVPFIFELVVGL